MVFALLQLGQIKQNLICRLSTQSAKNKTESNYFLQSCLYRMLGQHNPWTLTILLCTESPYMYMLRETYSLFLTKWWLYSRAYFCWIHAVETQFNVTNTGNKSGLHLTFLGGIFLFTRLIFHHVHTLGL